MGREPGSRRGRSRPKAFYRTLCRCWSDRRKWLQRRIDARIHHDPQRFECRPRVVAPSSREQAEEVQLIFGVQADASVFQEGQQIAHGLFSLVRTIELDDGPLQIFDAHTRHIQLRLDACGRVDQSVRVFLAMTWDELTELLSRWGEEHETKVNIVRIEGLEAVFLHMPPVAWFSSMKFAGALNMGVYQGEENRLVGTEQIPLAEVTPEFVRGKLEAAGAEWIGRALDPEILKEVLAQLARPVLRDVKGAS